jgi:hypothetical protein
LNSGLTLTTEPLLQPNIVFSIKSYQSLGQSQAQCHVPTNPAEAGKNHLSLGGQGHPGNITRLHVKKKEKSGQLLTSFFCFHFRLELIEKILLVSMAIIQSCLILSLLQAQT